MTPLVGSGAETALGVTFAKDLEEVARVHPVPGKAEETGKPSSASSSQLISTGRVCREDSAAIFRSKLSLQGRRRGQGRLVPHPIVL